MIEPGSQGLRIALVVEASSAGVGRHVADLAEGLLNRGHSIYLFYSAKRIDGNFEQAIQRLKKLGGKICRLDTAHNLHVSDLVVIVRLRGLLRASGPFDVVHCHSTKAGFVGRLAAWLAGYRSVYTPNAFVTMSPHAGLVARLGGRIVEGALGFVGSCVVCVSEEEVCHARSLRIPQDKTFLITNGIDIDLVRQAAAQRTYIRQRFGLMENDVCVGFVGRLFPQKAPAVLLAAFALAIQGVDRPVKLVIAGDGPLRTSLQDQAARLGISSKIHFAGAMNGVLAMSAFDLYALPSAFEGFPYVLVEAIASGLPVVSTAVGGARTLVRSGENGFVVPVGATSEFAGQLRELVLDDDLRTRFAHASRDFSCLFSADRMLNETLQVYETIMQAQPHRSPVESST